MWHTKFLHFALSCTNRSFQSEKVFPNQLRWCPRYHEPAKNCRYKALRCFNFCSHVYDSAIDDIPCSAMILSYPPVVYIYLAYRIRCEVPFETRGWMVPQLFVSPSIRHHVLKQRAASHSLRFSAPSVNRRNNSMPTSLRFRIQYSHEMHCVKNA